ncbi:MAG: hypothetical protein JXN65_09310 [Clostridia bacterium]|nr:hypothetical protein [Clostridia bacterium]
MTTKNIDGSYEQSLHRLGKIFAALALIIILGIPVAIMLYYNAMPTWKAFFIGLGGVAMIYVPVGAIEFFTYVPMLGTGSSYLMFVTGNLTNLKVPCALNALEVAEVKPGTKEADIIGTISVAVSAIVTDVIIIIGVAAAAMLQPLLESPTAAPAFANVIPALFGALGVVWLRKYWKIAVVPVILMLIAFIFVDKSLLGIMIPVAALIAILCARVIYKKGWQ